MADLPACCLEHAEAADVDVVLSTTSAEIGHTHQHLLMADMGAPTGPVDAGPLYAQLLGLGLVMIMVHCAGMCGPIVLSLRFGVQQEWQKGRTWLSLGQLAAYQGGRALVYAGMGAVVGTLGAVASHQGWGDALGAGFAAISRWLILGVAAGFIVAGLWRLRPRHAAPVRSEPGRLTRLGAKVARGLGEKPLRRAGLMGVIMAFIPCMIPIWTLGLAAVSSSPLHGALLMLLLVAMTTPALLPFAVAPGFLPKMGGRAGFRLQTVALLFSGIWLSLIGLAANDIIPHAHTALGDYTVKWW